MLVGVLSSPLRSLCRCTFCLTAPFVSLHLLSHCTFCLTAPFVSLHLLSHCIKTLSRCPTTDSPIPPLPKETRHQSIVAGVELAGAITSCEGIKTQQQVLNLPVPPRLAKATQP